MNNSARASWNDETIDLIIENSADIGLLEFTRKMKITVLGLPDDHV